MIYATGIVAEYNPFHNGHLHHLTATKKIVDQPIIAVMSGSFMQRGEPAFLNKWLRAKLAVQNGIDLVLELPVSFSLRSAQYFASGAVQLLNATGCVNYLSCGAESPKQNFTALAKKITAPATQELLRQKLSEGHGYAAACAEVLQQALDKPNDILALEYAKALLATDIKPLFIKRMDNGYNSTDIDGSLASATAIRQALAEQQPQNTWQQAVPQATLQALLQNSAGFDENLLWQLICCRLRLLSPAEIAARCQCSEGLENLLKQSSACRSFSEALQLCTKKRYSTSRIRRLLMQLLLDSPRAAFEQAAPAYLRVLAFNDTGRQLLKQMKATAALPIITKLGKNYSAYATQPQDDTQAQITEQNFLMQIQTEIKASDIWSMLQKEQQLNHPGNDFLLSPSYVKR